MEKPKAYIIGQQGRHRNPQLATTLKDYFEIVEDNGFVPRESIDSDELVDHSVFRNVIGKRPLDGEVACYVAHAKAWKWLKESDEEFLAIFEDDALFTNRTLTHFLSELGSLRGNWQLNLELRPRDSLFFHALYREPVIRRSRIQPRGTSAYIISRAGASALLDEMRRVEKIDGLADSSLSQTEVIDFYICLPPVFETAAGETSLIGLEAGSKDLKYPRRAHELSFFMGFIRLLVFLTRTPLNKRSVVSYFKIRYLKAVKYCFSTHFWRNLCKVRRLPKRISQND